MKAMISRLALIAVSLVVIFLNTGAYAFYRSDVDEIIAKNFGGYGAKQMSMGGVGIMSMDGTALFSNPANLARVPRVEFNLGLSYQKYKDLSNAQPLGTTTTYEAEEIKTNTRLNTIILTIPYPTYRGSLVFGVGMVRSSDFDRVSSLYYEEGEYSVPEVLTENGGINQWGFGLGVDLSPRLAFGVALYVYHGKHDINFESNLYQSGIISEKWLQLLEYKYLGLGARLGVTMQLSRHIAVGLGAELPTKYNVDQDAISNIDGEEDYSFAEYDLKRPFIFSLGILSRYNQLTVMADVDYIDWTQLAYGDNYVLELEYNSSFADFYREVLRFKIGGEYVIPAAGLSIRGGYFINPLPFQSQYFDKDRKGFSLGFGLLIDQVMTMDFAFVHMSQTNYSLLEPVDEVFSNNFELYEEVSINRLYLTAAYRF